MDLSSGWLTCWFAGLADLLRSLAVRAFWLPGLLSCWACCLAGLVASWLTVLLVSCLIIFAAKLAAFLVLLVISTVCLADWIVFLV
jgi:hypothetical protein